MAKYKKITSPKQRSKEMAKKVTKIPKKKKKAKPAWMCDISYNISDKDELKKAKAKQKAYEKWCRDGVKKREKQLDKMISLGSAILRQLTKK